LNSTREGKPYCPEHIELHPYVGEVLDQLAAIDAEEHRIKRLGIAGVDLQGVLAKEAMIKLVCDYGGSGTVERISGELRRHPLVVSLIFVRLAKCGVVTIRRTKRGSIVVAVV